MTYRRELKGGRTMQADRIPGAIGRNLRVYALEGHDSASTNGPLCVAPAYARQETSSACYCRWTYPIQGVN